MDYEETYEEYMERKDNYEWDKLEADLDRALSQIQKLKKQNEILKSAVEFYADKKNINFMDGCHIEKNEDGEEVADGGYRARQALKDAEEIK
jgi:uridine kinase